MCALKRVELNADDKLRLRLSGDSLQRSEPLDTDREFAIATHSEYKDEPSLLQLRAVACRTDGALLRTVAIAPIDRTGLFVPVGCVCPSMATS